MSAIDLVPQGLAGTQFRVIAPGIDDVVQLSSPGLHQVRNLLAGIAVGITIGFHGRRCVPPFIILPSCALCSMPASTIRKSLMMLYNAAPTSMRAALELLGTVPSRRVAVLGDMRELGHIEESAHHEVGQWVAGVANVLVAVGARGRWIADGAIQTGMTAVYTAPDAHAAIAVVRALITPGDCVLVKGSRALWLWNRS
jgi:UDP-N-acetylmuramoyl-tripeptide--D-alanyl-D-alanine ligase